MPFNSTRYIESLYSIVSNRSCYCELKYALGFLDTPSHLSVQRGPVTVFYLQSNCDMKAQLLLHCRLIQIAEIYTFGILRQILASHSESCIFVVFFSFRLRNNGHPHGIVIAMFQVETCVLFKFENVGISMMITHESASAEVLLPHLWGNFMLPSY
jgi:hypothetical protein